MLCVVPKLHGLNPSAKPCSPFPRKGSPPPQIYLRTGEKRELGVRHPPQRRCGWPLHQACKHHFLDTNSSFLLPHSPTNTMNPIDFLFFEETNFSVPGENIPCQDFQALFHHRRHYSHQVVLPTRVLKISLMLPKPACRIRSRAL